MIQEREDQIDKRVKSRSPNSKKMPLSNSIDKDLYIELEELSKKYGIKKAKIIEDGIRKQIDFLKEKFE